MANEKIGRSIHYIIMPWVENPEWMNCVWDYHKLHFCTRIVISLRHAY